MQNKRVPENHILTLLLHACLSFGHSEIFWLHAVLFASPQRTQRGNSENGFKQNVLFTFLPLKLVAHSLSITTAAYHYQLPSQLINNSCMNWN